ncbi:MAG: DUF58 domain-containing protein [Gammaproteobacteria bacterium]|nr:DUF58 domain-containing protein [Gammaproteobacteria bacterium]MDH3449357.1 DUF58 domain-containing protein [Gammaproteobacteria bacterium]
MSLQADKVPGISIDVDDLVRLRGHLAGSRLAGIRRRASYRSGVRDTRARGRGMEYEETRAYVAGDDVRTMDWRVMARTGEAHTKIFAEEKERRFLLAVDLSASMFYGTRQGFKSWAAAQTAAHLGWLASFAGDRVGGLIVAPDSHHEVRPGKTRAGLLNVFHHLAEASRIDLPPASRDNRLNFLLRELQRVVKPGSIIALISDFIGLDHQSMEILSALIRHNDVNAFWIYDTTEANAWPAGHYQVLTDRHSLGFDITGKKQDEWLLDCQRQHRLRIENLTSSFNIPLIPVSCNQGITRQIMSSLKS